MSAGGGVFRSVWLAAMLSAVIGAPALAQSADAPAPEKFKDWELACPAPKPVDKARVCEVRTVIIGKDNARLGALAIALNPDPKAAELPMVATVLLPLGVGLVRQPQLQIGETIMQLQFQRCLQRGCEAVGAIDSAQLAILRSGSTAKVTVGIGGGKLATFEFSLTGFSAAHDAMKKRTSES